MKDADLNLLEVTGSIFGYTGRKITFDRPEQGEGRLLDPLGFAAVTIDGKELEVDSGEGSWSVHSGGKDFKFSYKVVLTVEDRYSTDIRCMLSSLDEDKSRLMGRDLFLLPRLVLSEGVLVDMLNLSEGAFCSPYESVGRRMIVPDLSDLPMALAVAGDYRFYERDVSGASLVLAITGKWSFMDEELLDVITNIVGRELAMFGSFTQERYLFVCEQNPARGNRGFDSYGVHFGGSMLLLLDDRIDRSQLYDTPMSIVAHEFFHNWNGESLVPAGDRFMWFTEGATVYYSYKVLLETRIIDERQYGMQREIRRKRYLDNVLLDGISISEAGNSDLFDKNLVNMLYDGGFLAAEALDEKIIDISSGSKSLIDILRIIYEENPHPVKVDEKMLVEVIERETGCDISKFLEELVRTTASPLLSGESVSS